MKRISTDAEYLDNGRVVIDADGIPFEPASKEAVDERITDEKWERPQVSNVDANLLTDPGIYPFNLTSGATNLPVNAPGTLETFGTATFLIQRYTTWNGRQMWLRNREPDGTAWSEWVSVNWYNRSIWASDDANSITQNGVYGVAQAGVPNLPAPLVGTLEVVAFGSFAFQQFVDIDLNVYRRRRTGEVWTPWVRDVIRADIDNATWYKKQVSNIDANTFDTPGMYPLNLTSGASNLPVNAPGVLEVMGISTQLIQRFTRKSPHQVFVRNRNADGNTWSDWSPIQWVVNGIGTNDNADSISVSGMYPVTQAGVPNLPESAIGTLEVVAFSTVIFQTFTSIDLNVWKRRKVSSGAWTAWEKTPDEGDIQQAIQDAQAGVSPADSYVREGAGMYGAGLYLREIVQTDVSGQKYPAASTDDGTKMWNGNSGAIEETTDGVTWTKVHTLEGGTFTFLRPLPDGEVLICFVPSDGSPRQIKKSVGYGTEGMTFKTVINPTSPTVRFVAGWSYFQEGDRILIAEYGSKYPSVDESEWPRYVYYSNDCGDTFQPIFNLWDFLQSHGVEQQNELHVHGVAYDKYWDRIWVTWGDNTNGIAYSDDEGVTWHVGNLYLNSDDPWQGVGIYPMPECILVGSDLTPNGVWRIDRKQGKNPDGQYEFEAAYKINDSIPRTHLCHSITRVPGVDGRPDLVLFGFGAESNPGESIVVGTWDGWGFNVMYRHGELHAAGQGLRGVVPASDGTVHINMQFGSQRLLVSGKSWSVARQLAG